jgi:hypothetical protein
LLELLWSRATIHPWHYGMESDVTASRDAGFAEHLTKPALDAANRRVSSSDD